MGEDGVWAELGHDLLGKPHKHALRRAWLDHKADRKLLRRWCEENRRIGALWGL